MNRRNFIKGAVSLGAITIVAPVTISTVAKETPDILLLDTHRTVGLGTNVPAAKLNLYFSGNGTVYKPQ